MTPPLNRLDDKYPLALCADQAPESRNLEFKRHLPELNDKGKAEFLKDVTAFANSDGGDMIYGIVEKSGSADYMLPIDEDHLDDAIRRLAQLQAALIEPTISGVRYHRFKVDGGGLLMVRVPQSFSGPHRYSHNGHKRFAKRDAAHVEDMAYSELRSAFLQASSFSARAREVRSRAITRIFRKETWRPLLDGPTCLVQIVPMAGVSNPGLIDISKLYKVWNKLILEEWGGGSPAFNVDGFVVYRETKRIRSIAIHKSTGMA